MFASNSGRRSKLLALDWDTRTLRIVHASLGKRGVTIDRLLAVANPPSIDISDPKQMGSHIRKALDQERIVTKHATVDIPRDQVILNTLSFPKAAREELPGMVQIQIAKELPFAVGDACIDFTVSSSSSDEATIEVLVAAVRREVVQQYVATFEAAGLKLDRIGLRPYANKVAVCELLKHGMPERVVFVDVRPSLTEIGVLHNSALAFSRAASVAIPKPSEHSGTLAGPESSGSDSESGLSLNVSGIADTIAQEQVIQPLVSEVAVSIEAYRAKEPGAQINHVVISGDVGVEEVLAEVLQKRLGVTSEIYNPASSFGWEPDEGASAAAFSASLGLVLSHASLDGQHFDFLHPKRTESVTQKRLKMAPLAAAVAIFFVAAGAVGVAGYTKEDRLSLASIEKQIQELEGNVRQNKKFLKVVDQITAFDREQCIWIDVLADMFSALPTNEQLVIERIDTNQKDSWIALATRAKTREVASEVIRALEDFRREGKELPLFKVDIGTQSEKAKESYPFTQKFTVRILDDVAGSTSASRKSKKRR